MLNGIELYRTAFAHETWADHEMLQMLGSVPSDRRSDPLFTQAVSIAAHMAKCRHQWLGAITIGSAMEMWHHEDGDFAGLEGQFQAMESAWASYLGQAGDELLESSFDFSGDGGRWRMRTEVQLFQLIGHAAYHRGQVALLVEKLGGEVADTDYADWYMTGNPDSWSELS